MNCLHPHLASITSYDKGCRCRRCRQARTTHNKRMKQNQCFESGMSQASIDRWALEVVSQLRPAEKRLLRELDI